MLGRQDIMFLNVLIVMEQETREGKTIFSCYSTGKPVLKSSIKDLKKVDKDSGDCGWEFPPSYETSSEVYYTLDDLLEGSEVLTEDYPLGDGKFIHALSIYISQ